DEPPESASAMEEEPTSPASVASATPVAPSGLLAAPSEVVKLPSGFVTGPPSAWFVESSMRAPALSHAVGNANAIPDTVQAMTRPRANELLKRREACRMMTYKGPGPADGKLRSLPIAGRSVTSVAKARVPS